ncbi:MAG: hypothetical protein AAGP08_10320 [Pseudomonadota bacterium]
MPLKLRRLFALLITMTTVLLIGQTAAAQSNRFSLELKNECSQEIEAAVRYRDWEGNWQIRFWVSVPPGETRYVADTPHNIFYYYADSPGTTWPGEDHYQRVGGDPIAYGFRRKQINKTGTGTWTQILTCTGMSAYQVRVANRCDTEMYFAVHYKHAESNEWVTRGYFIVEPNTRMMLANTNNAIIYLHAGFENGDHYTNDEMREFTVRGRTERFMRADYTERRNLHNFCK